MTMTKSLQRIAATASLLLSIPAALAFERQVGPVNVELRIGAGAQVGTFDDPQTGLSGDDSDFTWSAVLNIERVTDGGALFGVHLEVDDGGRQVEDLARDELYIFYSSDIGRFELGEQDGAADVLSLRAPLVGLGQIRGEFSRYAGSSALLSPFDTGDAAKLVYVSAPFNGLRFGASYAPRYELNEDDPNPRNRTLQRDGIELGVQYQRPVGDWALGVSGAWVTAQADAITQRADIDSWSVGLQARRDKLVIGGAFVERGDSNRLALTNQDEFNVGVAWRDEKWGVALSSAFGKSEALDSRLVALGGFWNIGEYFVLRADLVHIDERRPVLPAENGFVAVVELGIEL
jgi:hypothetical protein